MWDDIYYPTTFKPDNAAAGTIDEQLISIGDFAPTFLSLAKAPIPNYLHEQNFLFHLLHTHFNIISPTQIIADTKPL